MEIHQFHSGTTVGDAITNQMLAIQRLLRSKNYRSEIYAEHIHPQLTGKIKPISAYTSSTDNLLFVHHSMGFDGFERIVSLSDKKALVYHNITPERFFTDSFTREYIRKGIRQTRDYLSYVNYAIADSNYNRRELIQMGYRQVDVMPVQISLDRFDGVKADRAIMARYAGMNNVLFVGRLVPNKHQDDIIRAFAHFCAAYPSESRLLLVGDDSMAGYANALSNLVRELGIQDQVDFLGKVSDEELKACYTSASVFVCLSEHEGFGVPLLEAMVHGIPVIAYRASAVAETMGGAGILLEEKHPPVVAAAIHKLLTDRAHAQKIVKQQNQRIERLKDTDTEKILLRAVNAVQKGARPDYLQMQGPFETSYSLAIVNRRLTEALHRLPNYDVSIHCTEGPGDYLPKAEDLRDKPTAKILWEKSREVPYPDIVLRNMYPPRVSDTNGSFNLQSFAWEESVVPAEYVEQFNRYMQGVGTTSQFVTDSLVESGLGIPVATMGNGVELPDNFKLIKAYPLLTKKKTRFLHISSAFPRKGVDVLLRAFYAAFQDSDDVCLVLKTFPNPHNVVQELLDNLNAASSNPPEIIWINEDLPNEDLYSLYKAVSCYVHVARGEGFGLPVAEAMLARIPVIVSPNTGLADFCNEDTCLLVDYQMEPASSHLSTNGAMWAVPNEETLQRLLHDFVFAPETLCLQKRMDNAYRLISQEFSWDAVARRWDRFICQIRGIYPKPRVAMLTTWNSKCGIAEYSRMLWEYLRNYAEIDIYPNHSVGLLRADEDFVKPRLWHSAFQDTLDKTAEALLQSDYDVVHIQFNFGFFQLNQLENLIKKLFGRVKIVITFHKTNDADVGGKTVSLRRIAGALGQCHRLIVHQQADQEVLTGFGIPSRLIKIIPLGQMQYRDVGKDTLRKTLEIQHRPIIGSYGFLLSNKGVRECIQAVALLKEQYPNICYIACCALHDSMESKQYFQECKQLVENLKLQNNVVFFTQFLSNQESITLLQLCDILLMPYLPSTESASGAIRLCVAAQRPLITTAQKIFDEFKNCTLQIEQADPQLIVEGVRSLLTVGASFPYLERMRKFIRDTSWHTVARDTSQVYREDA